MDLENFCDVLSQQNKKKSISRTRLLFRLVMIQEFVYMVLRMVMRVSATWLKLRVSSNVFKIPLRFWENNFWKNQFAFDYIWSKERLFSNLQTCYCDSTLKIPFQLLTANQSYSKLEMKPRRPFIMANPK